MLNKENNISNENDTEKSSDLEKKKSSSVNSENKKPFGKFFNSIGDKIYLNKKIIEKKFSQQQEKLKEFEAKKLSNEFLPPALEIAETPASPAGRFTIWSIFIILTVAILWSVIGKVDEVAVARGKLVPDGRIKVIQPIEEGIITEIFVEEGQKVKKDEPLIELDSSIKEVDMESLNKSKTTTEVEIRLLNMILEGKNIEEEIYVHELDEETKNNLILLAKYQSSDFEGQKNVLELVSKQNQEQVKMYETELNRMKNELSSLQKRANSLEILANSKGEIEIGLSSAKKRVDELVIEENIAKQLYDSGGLSKREWEEIKSNLEIARNTLEAEKSKAELEKITRKQNYETAKAQVVDMQNQIRLQEIKIEQEKLKYKESLSNIDNLDVKKNETILDLLVQKEKYLSDIQNQISKIEKSVEMSSLKSPIDGTVHGLSTNTIGGVVTLAQPIMTIVPDGTPLVVEAMLQNKDVGFVKIGQEVEIKVDTFPYQRYGMFKGVVESVSPDAFEDEKLGLVYKVKVSIADSSVMVDGIKQSLNAGMSVSAEIKTGKRRIISFFLEPFVKNVQESVRIR